MSEEKKQLARQLLLASCEVPEIVEKTGLTRQVIGGLKSTLLRSGELPQKAVTTKDKLVEEDLESPIRPQNASQVVEKVLSTFKVAKKSKETILSWLEMSDTPLNPLDFMYMHEQTNVKHGVARIISDFYDKGLRDSGYSYADSKYSLQKGTQDKKFSQSEVDSLVRVERLEGMFKRLMDKFDNPNNPNDGEIKVLRDELKDLKEKMVDDRFKNLEVLIKQQNKTSDALTTGINRLGDISEKWIDSDQSTEARGRFKKVRRWVVDPLSDGYKMPTEKKLIEEQAELGMAERLQGKFTKES